MIYKLFWEFNSNSVFNKKYWYLCMLIKPDNMQITGVLNYLNSATGVNSNIMIAGSPGISGITVVSLATTEEPLGFKPTKPATIILWWGSWGSSSMVTEFTLSGSTLVAL